MSRQAHRLTLMASGLVGWTLTSLIWIALVGNAWGILLGLAIGAIIGQSVIFFVVAPILWKRTYTPIQRRFGAREER